MSKTIKFLNTITTLISIRFYVTYKEMDYITLFVAFQNTVKPRTPFVTD